MTSADSFDIFLSDYANVSRYLSTELSTLLTTYHLTLDAFLIMHEIGKSQAPLLLMDIAHRHHVSRSAISRQISALLSYGYVQQQANASDRRQKSLLLTDSGREIDQQLVATMRQSANQWANLLGPQRVTTLLGILEDFNDQVVNQATTE